ncbi:MAG TPA: glycosyltransferase family 4 protein [Candidatus Nealsonbacteria bacterium]|uniref:Glycosyl transferase family 1 domain-containing protein n=1 Tax=marine sediment metagenome TaxID=412755 RepID=A0A0F9WZD8_9ZZZZ|nr:glycosyltransferase family 4 protein [Candidatus Nealsonbacteria bacterium]HEB46675.1 glycosyltransferase family 4 protein [Candidatus Nealsonbacteria bacterium]
MKILIVAPLKRKVGPEITAARPRVIFDLSLGLIKAGHMVSILGTKNSFVSGAKIIPIIPKAFGELKSFENPFYAETGFLVKQAKILEKIGNQFDIIHNHSYPEFINLLVIDKLKVPVLTTIHAQMTPQLDEVLSQFNDLKNCYFISISYAHKKLAEKTKIWKVIHNGVDTNLYRFSLKKDDYLLWIGRLSKAKDKRGNFLDPKGVRWAIKLAKKTNSRLLLSGNVEDPEFFKKDIKPYLNNKIKWIGPISSEQPLSKKEVVKLMQKAKTFLMTVNWYEPFGLVVAESMSCGTPVIGFDRGAVSELVANGKTGFVVKPKEGIEGLKKALNKIDEINPRDCRKHIEKNFSLKKMVENYEKAYKEIRSKT